VQVRASLVLLYTAVTLPWTEYFLAVQGHIGLGNLKGKNNSSSCLMPEMPISWMVSKINGRRAAITFVSLSLLYNSPFNEHSMLLVTWNKQYTKAVNLCHQSG
jgi:hypothetical protein